jgi:sugar O-acyltransferase (sialic acid O-acetyltransferase NeuD family)
VRIARESTGYKGSDFVFADDNPSDPIMGIPVIAPHEIDSDDRVVIAVGDSKVRERLAGKFDRNAGRLISPSAIIGPDVEIGEGTVICDLCIVTASAKIGRHFQCNIYSYVAHDCVIGDFVTFAPKVCCNGNVHVHEHAYIGTGAVIKQGTPGKPLIIGNGAIVGMGAVVTKDIPEGATVVGNPARPR